MTQGGVYRLGINRARREVVVAHRKGVGGLVAHRDGGLVVTGRNVAQKAVDRTTMVVIQTAAPGRLSVRASCRVCGAPRSGVGCRAVAPGGAWRVKRARMTCRR